VGLLYVQLARGCGRRVPGAKMTFSDVLRVCDEISIPYYSADFTDKYMDGIDFATFLRGVPPRETLKS
jgi:tRNA U34 2-thiouridine synthase MnmA/TrmU